MKKGGLPLSEACSRVLSTLGTDETPPPGGFISGGRYYGVSIDIRLLLGLPLVHQGFWFGVVFACLVLAHLGATLLVGKIFQFIKHPATSRKISLRALVGKVDRLIRTILNFGIILLYRFAGFLCMLTRRAMTFRRRLLRAAVSRIYWIASLAAGLGTMVQRMAVSGFCRMVCEVGCVGFGCVCEYQRTQEEVPRAVARATEAVLARVVTAYSIIHLGFSLFMWRYNLRNGY
jgi:hypothetical protein